MAKTVAQKGGHKASARGHGRQVRPALWLTALILLLVGGFFSWMAVQANLTHLKQAQVYLADLPEALDGTTILYLSDIDIRNAADAARSARLMARLKALKPDVLLLGGDYSAGALGGSEAARAEACALAEAFARGLGDFEAPLGKFAVTGENDTNADALARAFADAGVTYLSDGCAAIERSGQRLVLAGLGDVSLKKTPFETLGRYFSGDECVLVLAHNPAAYVGVRVSEARGGGKWADLVLAGHTLGGQIKLFGRTLRTLPEAEARCLSGWYYLGDLPLLVSQGLGCEDVRLRLDTQSEIYLLTLRRAQTETLPDL